MLYLILGFSVAQAEDLVGSIDKAREALVKKEYAKALELLEQAEGAVTTHSKVVKPKDLASIWYYRGTAKKLLEQDPLGDWRQALIFDLQYQWEDGFIDSSTTSDFFLNIRDEVKYRPQSTVCVPEKYGQAKLYVNGYLLKGHSAVPEGRHFAQIECPKGEVYGQWTDFSKQIKWLKMCKYSFDVEDMPVKEEEDEFGEFGAFGSKANATPVATLAADTTPCTAPTGKGDKTFIYAAAGTAAVSGVVYLLALQGRAKYDDFEHPDVNTPEDLSDIRKSVNTQVFTSAGLGGVAIGLYGYAMWKYKASQNVSTK